MPGQGSSRSTPSRKRAHVDLILKRDVGFRGKTTGLERFEFVHNALPELNYSDIDTGTRFLGKELRLPLMVSSMTGGYAGAERINRILGEVCEERGIALGVGSQRQALENSRYHRSFSVVREAAPHIPIVGNIGATEVATMPVDDARAIVDLVQADALTVHLNPLQELLQPEGNTDFHGVLKGIGRLCRDLPVPVIVKEIGAGISPDVARRLIDAGVRHIDVAGAGGTSWAGVEILRRKKQDGMVEFWNWGIPLADALRGVHRMRADHEPFTIIASGGIANGLDAAKCLALGADMTASARLFLSALQKKGKAGLMDLIDEWGRQMRGVMFLVGAASVGELQKIRIAEAAP